MRRLVLTKPVTITGRDFWGRGAEVRLEPTNTGGWFWRSQGEDIPLSPSLVHHAPRRLMLKNGNDELHVFEHLGPLRFTGLDGIRIVPKTKWLPYDGRSRLFWNAIRKHLHSEGSLLPMQQQLQTTSVRSDGMRRCIEIDSESSHALSVTVRVNYPEWGSYEVRKRLPEEKLTHIFDAKPLARPPWIQPIARIATTLGWPHYENVLWTKGQKASAILHQITLHRLLDFLGAMSVIPRAGEYLTGRLFSDCGNHEADVHALRRI